MYHILDTCISINVHVRLGFPVHVCHIQINWGISEIFNGAWKLNVMFIGGIKHALLVGAGEFHPSDEHPVLFPCVCV